MNGQNSSGDTLDGHTPLDPLLHSAFAPESGTSEQWNEAYARLSDYFRACRINSRLHRTRLVLETLRLAAKKHAAHTEFTPTQVAMHEARRLQKKWLRDIVGDLKLPEDRLEANGRLAFLMADGPRRWPEFFLKRDAVPPDMTAAMRRRVEQSGPDLAVSSMVPREIDLGFIPEIADDTFEIFEKYPMLRVLWVLLALGLAVWVGLQFGESREEAAQERARYEIPAETNSVVEPLAPDTSNAVTNEVVVEPLDDAPPARPPRRSE